ncbi:MAG: cytochrome c3 family protein [Janthinobacterium lividum]
MAQVFDRSSNALARAALVLTGLIVVALGVALNQLQRSPWVTRQGQRADQPVPFSHRHHVEGLGIQCQYCHVSVEKTAYSGIPPTKTCMNCHAQIWTNAQMLEPVRHSWATGESIKWIRVHDLPDYVYFNHSIHVNKGIGCASCHGRVDEMPIMYMENSLQMEWCLNCHRNPSKNLRPTSEIYNMAWAGPSTGKPVWCAETGKAAPTAQGVTCTTKDPGTANPQIAMLQATPPNATASPSISNGPVFQPGNGLAGASNGQSSQSTGVQLEPNAKNGAGKTYTDVPPMAMLPASYHKFTSQEALGTYLADKYRIRTPHELQSCEVCHR